MSTIGKSRRITESLREAKCLKNHGAAGTAADHSTPNPVAPKEMTTVEGERYTIVCIQQDDGRYLAGIAEAPEIRFVGKTHAQAERVVSKIYTDTRGQQEPHNEEEDRLWVELARGNRETQGITPSEYRRHRGRS